MRPGGVAISPRAATGCYVSPVIPRCSTAANAPLRPGAGCSIPAPGWCYTLAWAASRSARASATHAAIVASSSDFVNEMVGSGSG